jgi:hypothetical protein
MTEAQGMEYKTEYRLLLTQVQWMCTMLGMARLKDIVRGLGEQTAKQHEALTKANDELSKLRTAVQRFRELEKSVRANEDSLRIGLALLLNGVPQKINPDGDAYVTDADMEELREQAGLFVAGPSDLELSKFPLWKVMREILKQTAEIRVYELEDHLKSFGVKAARSAIESALATHANQFRIIKRGREKFVSLK